MLVSFLPAYIQNKILCKIYNHMNQPAFTPLVMFGVFTETIGKKEFIYGRSPAVQVYNTLGILSKNVKTGKIRMVVNKLWVLTWTKPVENFSITIPF